MTTALKNCRGFTTQAAVIGAVTLVAFVLHFALSGGFAVSRGQKAPAGAGASRIAVLAQRGDHQHDKSN